MQGLKVILVDDNEPFRNALKNVLMNKFHAQIIGEASCGAEFKELTNLHLADIILMDVMMPDIDGITLTKNALWTNKHLKFIAITMHYDKVYLTSLMGAGFRGCVFKSNIFSEIHNAIEMVMEGKRYFPKNILLENEGTLT
ncbi:MAG: response regulator transcription factor [Bacteroidales bacterium]|nr:response regulator transcription factor [Bacteroidales bacterium]